MNLKNIIKIYASGHKFLGVQSIMGIFVSIRKGINLWHLSLTLKHPKVQPLHPIRVSIHTIFDLV